MLPNASLALGLLVSDPNTRPSPEPEPAAPSHLSGNSETAQGGLIGAGTKTTEGRTTGSEAENVTLGPPPGGSPVPGRVEAHPYHHVETWS